MKTLQKVIRIWRGWTTLENAPKYLQLLREEVFPGVVRNGVTGLEQVRITTRELPGEVEFLLSLQFDCLDSVRKFAGENYRMAYIPENARKVLLRYDAFAEHYELAEELQLSSGAVKTTHGEQPNSTQ
ncbi:antibiotic biosynthesis monooxygenase [Robiginitalea sediminis]|uniref:antibiotic biosynthesis monooxygenase n=1 Tax=Robiginitalea sediminis TaxID=1982593 RepID=UPI000B4BE0BF|nr:antibiotic biosynthesis monooxygenase [Robiginitalea sediminis]